MNKTITLALLAATLVVPVVANADPNDDPACGPDGNVALGVVEIGTGDPSATFYIDDRNYALGNGAWIYQESNGVYSADAEPIDNLQRGGASELYPNDSETCSDNNPAGPDYLIF